MWVSLVVTVFLILIIGLVIWAFLSHERGGGRRREYMRLSGRQRIQCSICGNVYEDVPTDGLSKCPVCESFNETGGSSELPSRPENGASTNPKKTT